MASSNERVPSDSALHIFRQHTKVDCDTLNPQIAERYGTFIDCTSNQAIAYFELQEQRSKDVLPKAAKLAFEWWDKFPGASLATLAVDIAVSAFPSVLRWHMQY